VLLLSLELATLTVIAKKERLLKSNNVYKNLKLNYDTISNLKFLIGIQCGLSNYYFDDITASGVPDC
jgi:hypothetical protein